MTSPHELSFDRRTYQEPAYWSAPNSPRYSSSRRCWTEKSRYERVWTNSLPDRVGQFWEKMEQHYWFSLFACKNFGENQSVIPSEPIRTDPVVIKDKIPITHRIHMLYIAIYGNMDPINTPQMLAYIPAPWIRHGSGFTRPHKHQCWPPLITKCLATKITKCPLDAVGASTYFQVWHKRCPELIVLKYTLWLWPT